MKTIVFIAPTGKGGTYYYYKDITDYLIKNHSDKYNIIFCSSLKDYLLRHFRKADIIFSIIPFFFKPLGAKKYIFNLHGNFKAERWSKNLGAKLQYLAELNLWFSDKILLTNYFLADKLGFRNKYKKKIEILPNYVKPVKKNQRLKENDFKFLTITSFSFYEKGIGVVNLCRVIKKIGEYYDDKNILFTIIGDTQTKCFSKIKEQFDKIELGKNVEIVWKGFIEKEKIENEYLLHNNFLYRTNLDNMPGVLLDALNYGLRVFTNSFECMKYFMPKECIFDSEDEMLENIINKKDIIFNLEEKFTYKDVCVNLEKLIMLKK